MSKQVLKAVVTSELNKLKILPGTYCQSFCRASLSTQRGRGERTRQGMPLGQLTGY